MKMMKTSLLGLTAAVVLGVSSMSMASPAASAHEHTSKQRPQLTEAQKEQSAKKHLERRYADLKLSQAQLNKIEAIEKQHREQAKLLPQTRDLKDNALDNRKTQLHEQRLQLLQSKTFNQAQAQQWVQQQQEVQQQKHQLQQQKMAQHQLHNMKKEHAIFQVLDKKQQQMYLEKANQPKPHFGMQHGKKGKPHAHKHHHDKQHDGHKADKKHAEKK